MNLAEGILFLLGMTPIGTGLHDPPVELEMKINRVSRGDEQHAGHTRNLCAVSERHIHGLAEVDPVIARHSARC